jgi:hypothetical protein
MFLVHMCRSPPLAPGLGYIEPDEPDTPVYVNQVSTRPRLPLRTVQQGFQAFGASRRRIGRSCGTRQAGEKKMPERLKQQYFRLNKKATSVTSKTRV